MSILKRYTGPIVLRASERRPPVVPGNYYPRKQFPQWRNIYGKLVTNQRVTVEVELAEIRARHEQRREYHRTLTAARRARAVLQKATDNVTEDHRQLVESDA